MYGKIFDSLWTGSLYGKPDEQLVFIFLCANADPEGFVDVSHAAIAGPTGLSIEAVTAAIEKLEAPDDQSRSQELEGRRLERIDAHRSWGWRIVNYKPYRNLQDPDTRREQNRRSQEKRRATIAAGRMSTSVSGGHRSSASVSNGQRPSAQAEAEAEAYSIVSPPLRSLRSLHSGKTRSPEATVSPRRARKSIGNGHDPDFAERFLAERFWPAYPRRVARPRALKAMRAVFKSIPDAERDTLADTIMAGLADYCAQLEASGADREFIAHPATWLNGRRWEDDYTDAENLAGVGEDLRDA